MKHPELDKHEIIAWDFDGTLVNGINSQEYREYIIAHPEKKHFIVTFRNSIMALTIPYELSEVGFNFKHITGVMTNPTGESVADETVATYKARAAEFVGATILVDDMPEAASAGCSERNIVFMDANNLENRPFRPLTLPEYKVYSGVLREERTPNIFFD